MPAEPRCSDIFDIFGVCIIHFSLSRLLALFGGARAVETLHWRGGRRLRCGLESGLEECCPSRTAANERGLLPAPLGLEEAAAELRVRGLQEAGQRGGGARGARGQGRSLCGEGLQVSAQAAQYALGG